MKQRELGYVYSAPLSLWTLLFFLVPFVIIFLFSFFGFQADGKKVLYFQFTGEWYGKLLTNGDLWLNFLKTFAVALLTATVTLLIALPCSYYMARSRNGLILMMLVIIPFLINFLLRLLAWQNVLNMNGFLNDMLVWIGLVPDDGRIQFLSNFIAMEVVLIYISIPYAILPLYASVEKFDFGLLEAARDLGTTHLGSLYRVMLPNIMPGIVSAFLFTFIPTFGQFAIPLLVGDASSSLFGNKIFDKFMTANIPEVAAMSVILSVMTLAGILIYLAVNKKIEEYKASHNVQEDSE